MLSQPWLDQRELAEASGQNARAMSALQKKAKAAGWIRVHRIGRSVVWEMRPSAARDLTARSTVIPGRGSFNKRWLQIRLQAWLQAGNAEVRRGPKSTDPLEAVLPDGSLRRWVILPSSRMVSNLAKLNADYDGSSIVVLPTRTDARRTQTRHEIQTVSIDDFIKETPPTLLRGHLD